MKNFYLTFILLIFCCSKISAEIPQSEKDALLAIAESLYNPSNWNDSVPFEEWNGIVISEVDGAEHVTQITAGIQINSLNGNLNFSDQIQNLTYLNYLRFTASGASNFDVSFDFQYLSNLQNLEEIYIRLPSSAEGDSYYLLNTNQISEIDNLKSFTVMFNSPNFTLPNNFSNLDQLEYLNYENIYGYFPNYIYGLSALEELRIRVNISDFPEHITNLQNLSNLKILTINSDDFVFDGYLPDVLYNLSSLESLTFSTSNSYIIIEDGIANYNNQLKTLTLTATSFYLSENLWNLSVLEGLSLHSYSSDLYVPEQVQNLANLKTLNIGSDGQIYVPATIKNMTNLESLFLLPQQNSVYPEELYETPNLKLLVINVFDEVPSSIANFPNIESVQVVSIDGLLTGFPDFFGNMVNLKKLDFIINGPSNNNLFTIPENYFNWPNLEQFWTTSKVDADVTNKFLNSPNLEVLAFENFSTQNLRGVLNLCNNPKLEVLSIFNSDIQKIDLRNNETFTNGNFGFMRFDNNPITDFYVDDVSVFNDWVDLERIRITNNSTNYQVSTSTEECQRTMATADVLKENSHIYPNPTKDFIYFEKGKTISDVTVTSLDGKQYVLDILQQKVNVSYLPKGVYLMKYRADGVYYLEKFIKN